MPQLQKPLQGLARFLGLQSQGALAVNWTPNLAPVYDLGDWIGEPLDNQASSATVAQNGTFSAFTVPDGELWKIHALSVWVKPSAGIATNSYLRLLRDGSANGLVLAPTNPPMFFSTAIAGCFMHYSTQENGYAIYPEKLFLHGGDAVSVRLQGGTGAGNNEIRVFWQYQNRTL